MKSFLNRDAASCIEGIQEACFTRLICTWWDGSRESRIKAID
jgi:hypothetical protein